MGRLPPSMAWPVDKKGAGVVHAAPHLFGRGDDARQAFHPLAFLRLELVAAAVEGGRWDDLVHQGHGIGRAAVDMTRHRAQGRLGQARTDLAIQLCHRLHALVQAQDLGNPGGLDGG